MSTSLRFSSLVFVLASMSVARTAEINPADDFKYGSDETRLLITIRMDQLRGSAVFKRFEKAHPALGLEFRGSYGVEMANVRLLVLAETLSPADGSTSVVHLKEPATGEAVAAARSKRAARFSNEVAPRYVKEEFKGFTIFVPKPDYHDAFCLVDGLTIVSAAPEQLKKVLPLKVSPKHAELLRKEWRTADPAAAITIFAGYGAVIGGCKAPLIRSEVQKLTGVDLYVLVQQGPGVMLAAKFGPQVSLRATVGCRDEKGAKVVKEQYERLRVFAAERVKATALPKEVIEAPGKVQITVKAKIVEASLAISAEAASALLDTWLPASK